MRPPLFIGDRVTAAGFHLGGVVVRSPAPGAETEVFRAALESSDLILLGADTAAALPPDLLHRSLTAVQPLVLVIPDVRGRAEPPALADELRRQLGMAE